MGLDMYLHAEKRYDATDPTADQVLAAAGTTVAELERMATLDPYEHQTSVYLSGYEFSPEEERVRYNAVIAAAGLGSVADPNRPSATLYAENGQVVVSIAAAYWRKANSIHAWFVDNCQGGIDECQVSDPIDVEQLMYLRSLCESDAADYARGIAGAQTANLQPRSGFFFGGTDFDEWWAQDLADTVSQIDRIIPAAIEARGITFRYHSSW